MSPFISPPLARITAQVANGAQKDLIYSRFVPVRYQFIWSLTPTATTLGFQNPTSVHKYRESNFNSSVNVTNRRSRIWIISDENAYIRLKVIDGNLNEVFFQTPLGSVLRCFVQLLFFSIVFYYEIQKPKSSYKENYSDSKKAWITMGIAKKFNSNKEWITMGIEKKLN